MSKDIKISIDNREYLVSKLISGKEMLRLGGITEAMEEKSNLYKSPLSIPCWRVFCFITGPEKDVEVGRDVLFDVENRNRRKFYTANVCTTEGS